MGITCFVLRWPTTLQVAEVCSYIADAAPCRSTALTVRAASRICSMFAPELRNLADQGLSRLALSPQHKTARHSYCTLGTVQSETQSTASKMATRFSVQPPKTGRHVACEWSRASLKRSLPEERSTRVGSYRDYFVPASFADSSSLQQVGECRLTPQRAVRRGISGLAAFSRGVGQMCFQDCFGTQTRFMSYPGLRYHEQEWSCSALLTVAFLVSADWRWRCLPLTTSTASGQARQLQNRPTGVPPAVTAWGSRPCGRPPYAQATIRPIVPLDDIGSLPRFATVSLAELWETQWQALKADSAIVGTLRVLDTVV